ncbi:nucleoside recognition domain-containing protein [Paenibacillus paeoniae]|nr:nucleoside recognition domain-containing protein [Paenibacillus paeoniae]
MPKTILLAVLSILLVGSIIIQPDASFQASLQGLTVWWNIVFPGLLPFLVLYEIMLAFGLAHAIGSMLQPLMQRTLGLPGEAALALVFGWAGGYPAGSEAVASLRKREKLDRSQGQRLLSFAHMPNPLFMLVVIGAGFLHKPIAGMMIAAAVWVSALWLLLITSIFRQRKPIPAADGQTPPTRPLSSFAQGLQAGREQDGRSFGQVLGDAVSGSVQKLMVIGGFMIFAAVLSKLSEPLFAPLQKLGYAFVGAAFFESHLGSYAAAIWNAPGGSAMFGCAVIAAILAWSGIAGILQTGYAIAGTDLKLLPFVVHRLNHALHAFVLTLLLWRPLSWLAERLAPEGGFPVMMFGEYYRSSLNVSMPMTAMSAHDMPFLWLYSIVSMTILLAIMLILYACIPRKSRPARIHR